MKIFASSRRPPWSVLLIGVGNAAFAAPALLEAYRVMAEPYGSWNQIIRLVAPFTAVLMVALFLSIIGTWLGRSRARNLMVILFAIFTGMMIWQSAALVCSFLSVDDDIYNIPRSNYWNTAIGLRGSAWLAINVWYFYGWRGTDSYFRADRSKNGDAVQSKSKG